MFGPTLIADLDPSQITKSGQLGFFAGGNHTTGGVELWRSGGTANSTFRLKDIATGSTSSDPSKLTDVDGTLYFTAWDASKGRELWKSDGTVNGTQRVADLTPGTSSSQLWGLTNVGGDLYFFKALDVNGFDNELWKTNGTAAGTVKVATLDGTGQAPRSFTAVGNKLFWVMNDGVHGRELWVSNGTETGTHLVKDIRAGESSDPDNLTAFKGKLFFSAHGGVDGPTDQGNELWVSDGTAGGTTLFADIDPRLTIGSGSHSGSPHNLTVVKDQLFFIAKDDSTSVGVGLYKTNGISGFSLVKDLKPASFLEGSPAVREMVNVDGTLFFTNDADNGTIFGTELWKSDGTAAGTMMVKDITPGVGSSFLRYFTAVEDKLFFSYESSSIGVELWSSDGTSEGTNPVADLQPGSGSSHPFELTSIGSYLLFEATVAGAKGLYSVTTPNYILGSSSADTIVVKFRANDIEVTANGQKQWIDRHQANYIWLKGRGGNDKLTIIGSSLDEELIMNSGLSSLDANGYYLRFSDFETIDVRSGGGKDSVQFIGNSSDEKFVNKTSYAQLKLGALTLKASGFTTVRATAGNGGNDKAYLYDSSGVNRFIHRKGAASVTGGGINVRAAGFAKVYAYSKNGGKDRAIFYDTSGANRFYGRKTFSLMKGGGLFVKAFSFANSVAFSTSGGSDRAYLYDSAGNNRYIAKATISKMTGDGVSIRAVRFERSYGFSRKGGNDTALIYDNANANRFKATPKYGLMSGGGLYLRANGFKKVLGFSSKGNDRADIFDGNKDDKFIGRVNWGRMIGAGYYIQAKGFGRLNAMASRGYDTWKARRLKYKLRTLGRWEKEL